MLLNFFSKAKGSAAALPRCALSRPICTKSGGYVMRLRQHHRPSHASSIPLTSRAQNLDVRAHLSTTIPLYSPPIPSPCVPKSSLVPWPSPARRPHSLILLLSLSFPLPRKLSRPWWFGGPSETDDLMATDLAIRPAPIPCAPCLKLCRAPRIFWPHARPTATS